MVKKIRKMIPLLIILTLCLSVCQVQATGKKSCKVTFLNNAGNSSSDYHVLGKTVSRGDEVKMPAVPARKGKHGMGWTTVSGGDRVRYRPGEKVKIRKSTKFYAVFVKDTVTVKFFDSGGDPFTEKPVTSGDSIVLPAVPDKEGYSGLGWSTRKNFSVPDFHPGEKIRVNTGLNLYAVYQKTVTVSLYGNDGSLYKTVGVGRGEYFILPTMKNENNHTMLGWSPYPGKNLNPEYEAGESVMIYSDRKFYAVMFDRNNEIEYYLPTLPVPDTSRYSRVILVGDSRMERLSYVLGNSIPNVSFVAEGGKGLRWLKSHGRDWLLEETATVQDKPTAVVFNMGINDMGNVDKYISFYQKLAGELKGCRLFFMSLNPINSENEKEVGITERKERREEWVISFNDKIRTALCTGKDSIGTYIDSYTFLIRNGYGMDSGRNGVESGVDDGLHYSNKTYKRIYKYCMDFLNGRL